MRERCPAGVQPQFLRFENKHLAVEATAFIKIGRSLSGHDDIVSGVFKLSIMRHPGRETLGLIIKNLHMKTRLLIQFFRICVQLLPDIRRDSLVQILPYTVPLPDEFHLRCHNLIPP